MASNGLQIDRVYYRRRPARSPSTSAHPRWWESAPSGSQAAAFRSFCGRRKKGCAAKMYLRRVQLRQREMHPQSKRMDGGRQESGQASYEATKLGKCSSTIAERGRGTTRRARIAKKSARYRAQGRDGCRRGCPPEMGVRTWHVSPCRSAGQGYHNWQCQHSPAGRKD